MCDKSESPIHGSLVITIFLILNLDRVTPLVINRSQPDCSVFRSWGLGPLRGHGVDIKNRLILQEKTGAHATGRMGRMTKKCGATLCIPNLTRHLFVIPPSWVLQPSCCVSSLLLAREKGKQLHRPIKISCWKVSCILILGNLRSYDGNCNKNVTLKLNFALS